MRVPTEADWGEWRSDVDCVAAHDRFAGTSREEATRRFGHGDIIERIDEVRFMPLAPLRFYLLALCDYVRSPEALGNPDPRSLAGSFLALVQEKLDTVPETMRPVLGGVMTAVEYVASHQKRFWIPTSSTGATLRRLRRLATLAGWSPSAEKS